MTATILVQGQTANVRFRNYDIAEYQLFLKAKALPEKRVEFDPETDAYVLTTHRRFATRLSDDIAVGEVAAPLPISSFLFDYQRFIVERALEAQRFAVFADTGLGKTPMQLELARQVLHLLGGKFLLLTLPDIIPQTIAAGRQWYPEMPIRHLKTREELIAWLCDGAPGVGITNYQKFVGGVIPEFRNLSGLAADESSVLKTGGGTIKWNLVKSAKGIPYKFSFSATPAPNDVAEYASQASFLEKIQGFWDHFTKAGNGKGDWYIKPHARQAFYQFMVSWSIYMRSPKRFGFADNLAALPEPVFHDIPIQASDEQRGFAMGIFAASGAGLFGDASLGVTQRTKLSQAAKGFVYDSGAVGGMRRIPSRKPYYVAEIVRQAVAAGRQVLVWTVFDEESRLVAEALEPLGVAFEALHGEHKEKQRLEILDRFRSGETRALVSKAQLLGFGLNFQFCTAMVFSGWDDSYERYYQAVRRAYRYGQTERVQIYMPVVTELEGPILDNLMRKRANFEADAQAQEDAYIEAMRAA